MREDDHTRYPTQSINPIQSTRPVNYDGSRYVDVGFNSVEAVLLVMRFYGR